MTGTVAPSCYEVPPLAPVIRFGDGMNILVSRLSHRPVWWHPWLAHSTSFLQCTRPLDGVTTVIQRWHWWQQRRGEMGERIAIIS